MIQKRPVIALLCAAALATGCAAQGESAEEVSLSRSELYYSTLGVWESTEIPVCWVSTGNNTEKAWIRDTITNTWGRHSALSFTGWGNCTEDWPPKGIQLTTSETDAYVPWIGNMSGYASVVVNVGAAPETWAGRGCTGATREQCIRLIALHEFGHALSFAHEHNRPDDPNVPESISCTAAPQGQNGNATYGAWDPLSVMSYCNSVRTPSAMDYGGLVDIYGAERAKPIRHHPGGRCIHPLGGESRPAFDTPAVLYDGCEPEPRLQFEPAFYDAGPVLRHTSSGLCLRVNSYAANPPNGTRIVYGHCNTSAAVFVRRPSGSLQHVSSGKCVHPSGGSSYPANGTELVLWDGCDLERVTFNHHFAPGRLGNGTGMCVHPEGGTGNPANGTYAVFWPNCLNESRLGFRIRGTGSIQHIESGKCLHPEGGNANPPNNTRLVFWNECDLPRLKFDVTTDGQLRHVASGKCIAPELYEVFGERQGQRLVLTDCRYREEQFFGSANF